MTFGVVALIVICGWSTLSIVTSLIVGAMAEGRDGEPTDADRVPAEDNALGVRPPVTRQQHLAS